MKISYRSQTCTAEGAFEILAKANALEREKGIKVIHLEIGEPDFTTPKNIREACKKPSMKVILITLLQQECQNSEKL